MSTERTPVGRGLSLRSVGERWVETISNAVLGNPSFA